MSLSYYACVVQKFLEAFEQAVHVVASVFTSVILVWVCLASFGVGDVALINTCKTIIRGYGYHRIELSALSDSLTRFGTSSGTLQTLDQVIRD